MSIVFYSLITIITTSFVSFGLLFRLRKDHLLISRPFYWHWALGFFIFGLVHIPVLVINLGAHLSYPYYKTISILSYFTIIVAYLLFYRGVTLFLTKNKFWLNKFPIIIFLIFACLLILFFIFDVKLFILKTILDFSFVFPINLYLAIIFFYLHTKGCLWDGQKKRPSAILLSLAWFLIFALDIVLWYILYKYSIDLWVFKLASLKTWYLVRAASHLLILIGFLIYTRCWQYSKITKKTQK